MIATSLDAVTDVIGVALVLLVIAAASLVDRAAIARRPVGLHLVAISAISTVALVAIVVVRFIALA